MKLGGFPNLLTNLKVWRIILYIHDAETHRQTEQCQYYIGYSVVEYSKGPFTNYVIGIGGGGGQSKYYL